MLQPKRQKYRKQFHGSMKGMATAGHGLSFGEFGLKSLTCGWLTARQIEAARKTISHKTKRVGKLWIRVFPDKPYTKKARAFAWAAAKAKLKVMSAWSNPAGCSLNSPASPQKSPGQPLL